MPLPPTQIIAQINSTGHLQRKPNLEPPQWKGGGLPIGYTCFYKRIYGLLTLTQNSSKTWDSKLRSKLKAKILQKKEINKDKGPEIKAGLTAKKGRKIKLIYKDDPHNETKKEYKRKRPPYGK